MDRLLLKGPTRNQLGSSGIISWTNPHNPQFAWRHAIHLLSSCFTLFEICTAGSHKMSCIRGPRFSLLTSIPNFVEMLLVRHNFRKHRINKWRINNKYRFVYSSTVIILYGIKNWYSFSDRVWVETEQLAFLFLNFAAYWVEWVLNPLSTNDYIPLYIGGYINFHKIFLQTKLHGNLWSGYLPHCVRQTSHHIISHLHLYFSVKSKMKSVH